MRHINYHFSLLFLCGIYLLGISLFPFPASAANDLEISGWIPYWRSSQGANDAKRHLHELTSVHPFGFAVKEDGRLNDLAKLSKNHWKRLFKEARKKDVLIIPTVMWSDGASIHTILSDSSLRKKHIREIVRMVEKGGYDGVDIDYESKLAATKDSFSLFLKELKKSLDDKMLTCAIEARTPPDSLYRTIPAQLEYANDLVEIGKYCDRVQVMAYDQRRADIKLNEVRMGAPYMPVADVNWVRKAVTFMSISIPKEKLVIGVPTYGHEYEVTVAPNWYKSYARIRALNPDAALALAKEKDIFPSRNGAGEMSFSYWSLPPAKAQISAKIPKAASDGDVIAAKALSYANSTGRTLTVNTVWWSDAEAIRQKVELAKELGVAGVALFKIDGEEDRKVWDLFE
jgi:spore germination protein YaaH